MANPTTQNVGIIVPNTGADVDTWGAVDVNPNMVAVDGLFAGVQTIGLTNANVTLTSPALFTPTPTPGPTQAQNAVLRFTGNLTGNVIVTLPLPGRYVVENLTTGAFLLQMRAVSAGLAIALPPGSQQAIYCDGTNVKFVGLGKPGQLELWGGLTTYPAWVLGCSSTPYLLCDGGVYNASQFPYLGAALGGFFGGNGITTFGVPDLRGRVPIAYDPVGRITAPESGINGAQIGAAGGFQSIGLNGFQNGTHFHTAGMFDPGHIHGYFGRPTSNLSSAQLVAGASAFFWTGGPVAGTVDTAFTGVQLNSSNGLNTTESSGGGSTHNNVQPAQVVGCWFIKT